MTVRLTAPALSRLAHPVLESGSASSATIPAASSATIPALLAPAGEQARTFDLRLLGQLVSFGQDRQSLRLARRAGSGPLLAVPCEIAVAFVHVANAAVEMSLAASVAPIPALFAPPGEPAGFGLRLIGHRVPPEGGGRQRI